MKVLYIIVLCVLASMPISALENNKSCPNYYPVSNQVCIIRDNTGIDILSTSYAEIDFNGFEEELDALDEAELNAKENLLTYIRRQSIISVDKRFNAGCANIDDASYIPRNHIDSSYMISKVSGLSRYAQCIDKRKLAIVTVQYYLTNQDAAQLLE